MKLLRKIRNFIQSEKPHLRDEYGRVSYSQCGEDMIVDYIFRLRGVYHPSYIDVGASHPYYLSNTALFYERGSRGINVEANPQLISLFQKYRAQDININVGMGDQECELEFYVMEDSTLSTFSKVERDYVIGHGKRQERTLKIRCTTVATILAEYCGGKCPDFLSLDAEGMDYCILQSWNFERYSPKIVCVEAAEYSPVGAGTRRNDLIEFLRAKGYFEYANTNLNAVMVNKQFWDSVPKS